ncbi:MAG: Nif11-like leader peptide family RiPP precursor [Schwartzia sp.]|nr:Nif11-like leader peptide family RiPP precursor [Schwartzia sp. (in: firmicutes)]
MATINKNELTKEQIEKAMACKNAEELMAAAKAAGFELARDEAEAYMAELADFELDDAALRAAAGGRCYGDGPCNDNCPVLVK